MEKNPSEKQKPLKMTRRGLAVALAGTAVLGVGAGAETAHLVDEAHTSKVIDTFSTQIQTGDTPGEDIYQAAEAQLKAKGIDGGISREDAYDSTGGIVDKKGNVQPGPIKIQITENGLGTYGIHVHTDSDRLANTD